MIRLQRLGITTFACGLFALAACSTGDTPGGTFGSFGATGADSATGDGSGGSSISATTMASGSAGSDDTDGDSGNTDPTNATDPTDTDPTNADGDSTSGMAGDSTDDGPVVPVCGDGFVGGTEDCDGANLDGQTCQSQGFDEGTVVCDAGCNLDTSGCVLFNCGNNSIEGTEVCDGTNVNGQTCTSQGFDGGTLGCMNDCSGYDTAPCFDIVCGDDSVAPGEVCDGTDLAGADCVSEGFAGGGVLACNADCLSYDASGCVAGGNSDCCINNGTPGCSDATCQAIICAADGFCCNTSWDQICADAATANGTCAPGCAGGGMGGSSGNCCFANGGVGCQDPVCQAAVCGADPFCCSFTYDQLCADAALLSPSCTCP